MRPPSEITCKKCDNRQEITDDMRAVQFAMFWGLGEKRSQWDFLSRRVKLRPPVQCTAFAGREKKGVYSYVYVRMRGSGKNRLQDNVF